MASRMTSPWFLSTSWASGALIPGGRPTAVDLAVTSGLKPDMVVHSAQDGSVSIVEYEARKREYLDTEKQCRDAGMAFAPFVLEAHGGGVGPTGRRVCGFIASAAAVTTGTEVEVSAAKLLRRISVALQRENARAVLRRMPGDNEPGPGAYPEAWGDEEA